MKASSMYCTLFLGISAMMSIAQGCSSGNQQETPSSSSVGSGGADAGRICTWSGAGGGVTIPDCAVPDIAVFQGTLGGQPYNATTASASMPGTNLPYTAEISLPALGHLHVEWEDPNGLGQFVPITAGSL